jgi:formiminoglutamase
VRDTIDMSAWSGRIDAGDGDLGRRWHQVVQPFDAASPPGVALLGFACDAGVRRNGGRPGAAAGPNALRRMAGNQAWHGRPDERLYDAGDVVCEGDALEAAQSAYASRLARILRAGHFAIGLGGGHEIAWATYQGLTHALEGDPRLERLGILNFDAHLDLRRPETDGRGTSGTPFLQIAEARAQAGLPFRYLCLGASEAANTPALLARARALGTQVIFDVEAGERSTDETLRGFIAESSAVYLTFCLDVLPPAVAPGVSAPSGLGVALHRAVSLLRSALAACAHRSPGGKLLVADVAELNPAQDPDGRTARTAARLIYEMAAFGR